MDQIKQNLINDILKLDKKLWIEMHRTTEEELEGKTVMELTMYMNSLIHVRENPV